ncbi:MAG: hypothetical protein ACR2P0_10965, partial [Acidimicrobiales bacterium]
MLNNSTAGSSALAALMAAFASLFVLCIIVVFGMAVSDTLSGSEALAASGFIAVMIFVIGAMFTPIAAALGAIIGALRAPQAAWLVGPVAGAVIGFQIGSQDASEIW